MSTEDDKPGVKLDYATPQPRKRRFVVAAAASSWFALIAFAGFGLLFVPGLGVIGLMAMASGAGCYVVAAIAEGVNRTR